MDLLRTLSPSAQKNALPDLALLQELWTNPWVVYSKTVIQKPEKVVGHLSRCIHRVAITNKRILDLSVDSVTFRATMIHVRTSGSP